MHVAIHTSGFRGYDLARAADISETPHFQSHLATEADIESLADLLDRTNLKLPAIDIGGFDSELCLVNLDDAERAQPCGMSPTPSALQGNCSVRWSRPTCGDCLQLKRG